MMMMDKTEMPTAEELLRKIQRLEEAHRLKYLIIKQKKKKKKKKNISSSPSSSIISFSSSAAHKHDDDHKSSAETIGDSDWTETQYMNILESMGRPVYMFDVNNRIVYWNQMAENLYGYTVSEALGKTPPDIIVGPAYSELSLVIYHTAGDSKRRDLVRPVSCSPGTVYHALLYGSDVAVKIFNKQEYPDDMIVSFRKEVFLMKRLRHPNILLFMGAVISPLHLCIVTEFLPRGSLFRLLQRSTTKLDWRRRVHMAMDIARGMNYLHHCQPPIIHCNLKSSNLLVDKNLTLKVGDFGLSRIKHKTYLATNSGAGTAQWMAPEVLRDEQVDEKSDVYSYGVVLWEITTGKIPWENLNSKQVIGAVGFMNQRLEIPNDVDPQWASLIESCWTSEPRSRPTFEEILIKLKDLQKKFSRAPI
ncbi:hypothetical protein SSX86_023764 [Deinandra increscens subsp. villosa]|uniref:non-specific serine/threonine protein kinase n=1 Tax=Deinandra increscens subsp. villosa TaxID=3103831 RepID=A0AAP0CLF8_9ASTR